MLRLFLSVFLLLAACSQPVTPAHKYVSIIVLETNCGEFDGAILSQPDGTIHVEHDIGLANKFAQDIPVAHGIKVIDGPCRRTTL